MNFRIICLWGWSEAVEEPDAGAGAGADEEVDADIVRSSLDCSWVFAFSKSEDSVAETWGGEPVFIVKKMKFRK